jgi:outer membrane receptor protein involved in Fe transport
MIGTLAAALTITSGIVAPATPAAAQTREYDIAAGPLKQALDSYVRQSERQIVYRADEVRSATSPGVHGRLSAEAALDALLAGSGFTTRTDGKLVAIVKEGNAPADAGNSPPAGEAAGGGEGGVNDSAAIVITGSNIRGSRPIGPLHTLDRNDIERSGYSQVGELIRSLPENFGGGENPGHVGVGAANFNVANASTVNLRGLGDGATLTLLNGRRMAGNASGQSVDISGIPLAALQRAEIVADGSSAIYGSDAVAGVVNFITREDFNGAEVSAHVGVPTEGGGLEQTYSALGGLSRPGWNALLSVERSDQDKILASQRSFTSQALPYIYLLRPQQRTSVFFNGGASLSDAVKLDLQTLWSDRSTTDVQQYRGASVPEHIATDSREYFISGGLDADLGARWSARVNASTARSSIDFHDTAGTTVLNDGYANQSSSTEAILNGPLLHLPGGALNAALGGGWRNETYNSSLGSVSGKGSHDILYLFGELHAPLIVPSDTRAGLNALEASASGRYEHYSDYGGTFTPKFGLRYVPLTGVALRATWGKSFKAPTFQQVSQPSHVLIYHASVLGGTAGNAFYVTGGGGDLAPERSTSWTIGTDIAPRSIPKLRIGITYFDIDYRDRVVNPIYSPTTAISNPAFSPYVLLAPSAATQARYLDGANVYNFSGTAYDPDTITAIVDNSFTNAASQRVRGADLSIRYDLAFSGGQVVPFANATWIRIRQRTLTALPEATLSGTLANVPQFRARGGATLEFGPFAATGIVNYQDGSIDTGVVPNRPIASLATVDLNLTYNFPATAGPLAGVDLTIAAQNLFNRTPPYALGPATTEQGIYYDSVNASPIGRVIAFNIRKRF